jgi:hypothetical protein
VPEAFVHLSCLSFLRGSTSPACCFQTKEMECIWNEESYFDHNTWKSRRRSPSPGERERVACMLTQTTGKWVSEFKTILQIGWFHFASTGGMHEG